jgi:exopolysaccharide biosynthesis predicted pyruvyltransferase EpsI
MEERERNIGAQKLKLDSVPPEMAARFENLAESLLNVVGDSKVYYHPNLGNWGDGLIRAGTRRFLDDLSIDYEEHYHKRLKRPQWLRKPRWLRKVRSKKSVLIYGGGGAWCSFWDVSEYVAELSRYFHHVIVLPSSFDVEVKIPNATLFCRDNKESLRKVDAVFCDDMAFYLGKQNFPVGHGMGNFFRGDVESAAVYPIPKENLDLSAENDYLHPVGEFFERLAPFSHIKTDRLHVAIASCLLGKSLQLYPGAYFKSQSVFRSSIQDNFPNVSFVEK